MLYAFTYSDEVLKEIFTDGENEFTFNSIAELDCFDDSNFNMEWKDETTFEVWYEESTEKHEF
ncbi:MAG TPA: hypothetical protein GXZ61_04140 [Clostridiales bacterium]|jgi:hypothetical protein|nr:hypothetical protein [Clostridiales bacterium]